MSVNEKMTAIADSIRAKTGGTESLTLDAMATEIPKVYEEGKKTEYDAFWDNFQQNGTRVNYSNSFGAGWTDKLFKPKYDILPTVAYMMFRSTNITDLRNLPVKLDFSNCTNTQYMFQWALVKYIGELDLRKAGGSLTTDIFAYAKVVSIDLLKIGAGNNYTSWFNGCTRLESLIIDGEIDKNGFDVKDCTKLNKASIESVITALSSTTSGLTVTFSKEAVNNAFGIDIDDESTYTEEWNTLRNSKSNWTFSYA